MTKKLYSIGIGCIFTFALLGLQRFELTYPIFKVIQDWKDSYILAFLCFFFFAFIEEVFKLAMYKQSGSMYSVYTFAIIETISYLYWNNEKGLIMLVFIALIRIIPFYLHVYWTKVSINRHIEVATILHCLFNYFLQFTYSTLQSFTFLGRFIYIVIVIVILTEIVSRVEKLCEIKVNYN